MNKAILNLGAGRKIIEGAVNHDLTYHSDDIDIAFDLNDLPYPFGDNYFDEIHLLDVIEHLIITPIQCLDECHRMLKKGGTLTVRYPLYTSETIHDDPTHRWFLSDKSLDYVVQNTDYGNRYGFYTSKKWEWVDKQNIKNRTFLGKLRKI